MMEVTISTANQKNALTKEEKKLLNKTWRLSLQSKVGGTQVVQQGTSMAWTLRPTLDQLYKDDREGWLRVFRRHLGEYLNTNAVFFNLILGMVMSMEKKHKDGEIDSSVISSVKASLMGPTAGIGDSLFFSCLRVVIAGVCIGLASTGSILAPILFLVLYTGIEYICRYVLLRIGYTSGTKIVDMAFGKGIIPLITEAASCLGAIMVGCLIYNNVSVTLGITATFNELTVDLQSILDSICPGLLALGLWWLTFKGLQKGKSPIYLIFAIMIGCVVLSFFGIITVAKGGWG